MTVKTSFPAYARAHRRPIGVVTLGFIQDSRAVLLLAACRTPKSGRLLVQESRSVTARLNTGVPSFESLRSATKYPCRSNWKRSSGFASLSAGSSWAVAICTEPGLMSSRKLALRARLRHLEQPVVEPHFAAAGVLRRDPVDVALHLALFRARRARLRFGIVGAVHGRDFACRVLLHAYALDHERVAQPHLVAGKEPEVALGRIVREVLALDPQLS